MANSGILKNIKATCLAADESHVRHGNADIVGDNVVISGNIITANGPKSAKEFANAINKFLKD